MSAGAAVGRVVRPPRLLAVLLLALLGVLLLPAAPASAHAVLVSSDPRDGARVAAAPGEIRLEFDETVQLPPKGSVVLSTTGDRIDRGAARLTEGGKVVVVPLRTTVPKGVYSLAWRVVSVDSHVVTGSIRFGVGRDVSAVEGPVSTASPLDVATDAALGVLYLGLALGVGLPAAVLLLWPALAGSRRVRGPTAVGIVLLLLATVADLLLRGPRAAGVGWDGVLQLEGLGYTATSQQGVVLLARIVLVAVLGALLVRTPVPVRRGRSVVLGLLGLAVVVSVALLGHAADGAAWLQVPAAVLHLAAMAVWLGGLVALLAAVLPQREPESALPQLRRWSLVAFLCVGALVVTGEIQAFPLVAPLDSLWSTEYGLLLLAKLGLVALVTAVAAGSQRLVARRVAPARTRLRRLLAIEVIGVLAILGVTGVLTSTPTARETYGPAIHRTTIAGTGELLVDVDRSRRGSAVIRVTAVDDAGAVIRLDALDGELSTPGISALDVRFVRDGDGWRSTDAVLPLAGEWTFTMHAEQDAAAAYAASVEWPVW